MDLYRKALRLYPRSAQILNNLGTNLLMQLNTEKRRFRNHSEHCSPLGSYFQEVLCVEASSRKYKKIRVPITYQKTAFLAF